MCRYKHWIKLLVDSSLWNYCGCCKYCVAFFIQDILSILASNKYYRIKYEYFKLSKIFFAGGALYILAVNLLPGSLFTDVLIKLIVSLVFPFVCLLIGCFEKKELAAIKKVGIKWKNPKEWLSNLRNEIQHFKD